MPILPGTFASHSWTAAMLSTGLCADLLGLQLLLVGGIGVVPLVLGLILFGLGAFGSFYLYQRAAASEKA